MNERTKQLWEESQHWNGSDDGRGGLKILESVEKFAELIVQECYEHCKGHILPKGMAEENDLNYNDGVMDCAIGLKQHFGVEE